MMRLSSQFCDSDGGGKVPLRLLPTVLQVKFGYDAKTAVAAEQATVDEDQAERQAVLASQQQVAQPVVRTSRLNPVAISPAPTPAAPPKPNAGDLRLELQKIEFAIEDAQLEVANCRATVTRGDGGGGVHWDARGVAHPNYVGHNNDTENGGDPDELVAAKKKLQDLEDQRDKLLAQIALAN